jgi:hypothetical protein
MTWLLWLACTDDPSKRRPPRSPDPAPSSGTTGTTGTIDTTETTDTTELPEIVALPFASAGLPVGTARFELAGGEVEVLSGDFAIEPDGEGFVVSYTGPTDEPLIAVGAARVTLEDLEGELALAAVLGDPELPELDWSTDTWGSRAVGPFPSAPFPDGSAEWDDPSVLVFVPAAFSDPGQVEVVTHLHGWGAVLESTVADERLIEQHAMSGRDALFVVPQGPLDASSGDFGRLEDDGGHARLVRDVVSALYRDGWLQRPALGTQALTSHSGGYSAAASLLDHGGLPISAVFLYDSLYGYVSTFEDFARDGGVLFSDYTSSGGTDDNNLALRADLEEEMAVSHDFRPDHLREHTVAIGFTESAHAYVMRDGLTHARWLAASPLSRSPRAPPELLAVSSDGATAQVRWRADRAPQGLPTRVQGSDDGVSWEDLASSATDSAAVPARAQIRLAGEDGSAGDSYAGGGGDWLVVDGFDRVFGGSWASPTHDFAARLGTALGGASTALDDAVSEGLVDLRDWDHVLWLLGDESTAEETFDAEARAAVEAYLQAGGTLLVTGSELGYATDGAFLDTLGVTFLSDDAGTSVAGGWTFGVVYPEDFPDVLAGDEVVWTYATGGAAAVGRADHRVLAVGFALETLPDEALAPALAELTGWF